MSSDTTTYKDAIYKLKLDSLYFKIMYMVYDLLHLNEESERRLLCDSYNSCYASVYLSSFYFSQDECEYLYHFPTTFGCLKLHELISERMCAKTIQICSSHDIAPIYRKVFQLEHSFYKSPCFSKDRKKWIKERVKIKKLKG
jgi:hypothetical protein